jgi:seryl-tRNA synthetase
MDAEMNRRQAGEEYDTFIRLYQHLLDSGSVTPEMVTDLSREITVEQLDRGIQKQDPISILIDAYLRLPNVCDRSVPTGPDKDGDIVLFEKGSLRPLLPATPVPYTTLGDRLGIFSTAMGEKVTGPGFPFVIDKGAALDRALVNYMLDTHTGNGYREIVAPTPVNERSLFNTGAFPYFGHRSFHIEGTDLYLNPTIEVQQTNMLKNVHFVSPESLPIRLVGYSRSFRIEDKPMTTYTLLHEFGKVEIFVATAHESWQSEYERALASVEEMLGGLNVPFRKVLLCTGSMGQGQFLTHDYYVYAPGSDEWWEVASCAYNGDFSSRRMNATYFDGSGNTRYVDTLHITAVSIPRMLSAIMENYQLENGDIDIPDALTGYTRGIHRITPGNQMKLGFS